MPQLGLKLTCSECGAKFYDLGKAAPACPRCGSPPAGSEEPKPIPIKRQPEPVAVKEEEDEDDDLPPFEASDEEIAVPEDDEDNGDEDNGDEDDEDFTEEPDEEAD